jgi:lipopolysaccharide biosynthesis protein
MKKSRFIKVVTTNSIQRTEIRSVKPTVISPARVAIYPKQHRTGTSYVSHFKVPPKPILNIENIDVAKEHSVLIVLHLFYADLAQEYLTNLISLKKVFDFEIIVTIVTNSEAHLCGISSKYENSLGAKVLFVPNIGKDIIPKLIAIESQIKEGKSYDYVFLMHDKKSAQYIRENKTRWMDRWKYDLTRVLFDNTKRNYALHLLSSDVSIGSIGSADHLHYGPGWHDALSKKRYENELHLMKHQANLKLSLSLSHISPSWFIGGTMFWMRWDILSEFYFRHGFDMIFTLAKNDVGDVRDPSFTHYLERFFGQMVSMNNMKTVGL